MAIMPAGSRNGISTGELDRQLDEVRSRLDGFQPLNIADRFSSPIRLPGLRERSVPYFSPASSPIRLKHFSEQRGCTMFVTMLSACLVLLHLQSKQTELTIRTQTAGRDRTELESLIGWFVNSIVLKWMPPGNPKF